MTPQETEDTWFLVYYEHCGVEWTDEWSCACDDECPVCGKDIEALRFEEIDKPT